MYCGTERGKGACPCGGVSTVLSGARVLSGFKRAEGPASVRLGAMPVLEFGLDVCCLRV